MNTAVVVLEAVVGVAAVIAAAAGTHLLLVRANARRAVALGPATATALFVLCGLLIVSLALARLGLADRPLGYDLAVGAAALALLWAAGPAATVRHITGHITAGLRTPGLRTQGRRGRGLLLIAVPVLLVTLALTVSWHSDRGTNRPVTALSVLHGVQGVAATVTRGHGDDAAFVLRVSTPGAPTRTIPVPPGETVTVPLTGRAGPGASIQLVADGRIARTVGIP